jgi:hypothetical protein
VKHKQESPLQLSERGKNFLAGAIGLTALAGVGYAIEAASPDHSIHHDTHEEQVSVTAGIQGNSETALAQYVQKLTGTPDSTALLVGRFDAQDPEHDGRVAAGEDLTISVEVPNKPQ